MAGGSTVFRPRHDITICVNAVADRTGHELTSGIAGIEPLELVGTRP
jgi:hypothetical protein